MKLQRVNCDGCDNLTLCQSMFSNDVWVMSLCYSCQPWVLECTECGEKNWDNCGCYYQFGGEGGKGDMKVVYQNV